MQSALLSLGVLGLASAPTCYAFAPSLGPFARSQGKSALARMSGVAPGYSAYGGLRREDLRSMQVGQKLASFRRAPLPRAGGVHSLQAMFTGIVEEMGKVVALKEEEMSAWDSPGTMVKGVTLTIAGKVALEGAYDGCSIAVNGVCLTVTNFDKDSFKVGVAPETLRLTNLGELKTGSPVNLERAAAIDGRNSGHMVQGHVDNVGTILDKWADNESLFIKVKAPKELMKYIVPKGFIAIDGTSLTVCEVNTAESWFTFMLIEYTQKHIIVPEKALGDKVNLEVDVVSKYVERSLGNIQERLERIEKALGL